LNEETCRLAAELAHMTGQGITGAITSALRERLAREQRLRGVEVRAQKLLAIGESCARHLGSGSAAEDHGDVLYDERGLPR